MFEDMSTSQLKQAARNRLDKCNIALYRSISLSARGRTRDADTQRDEYRHQLKRRAETLREIARRWYCPKQTSE